MEDKGLVGDSSTAQTFKVDTAAGIPTCCGFKPIDSTECISGKGQVANEPEVLAAEGSLTRIPWERSEGMVKCGHFIPGLANTGTSTAVTYKDRANDGDFEKPPFLIRPKGTVVDAHNILSVRKDLPERNPIVQSDPRAFLKQSEKYRQELRQYQIQQWVLKHSFRQESLPIDCWPGKYPQITVGKEKQSMDSVQKTGSGKVILVDQARSSTGSLFKDPPKAVTMKKHARFVSNDAITDTSGILHVSESVSMKRVKSAADLAEKADEGFPHQGTSVLCDEPKSSAFVGAVNSVDGADGNGINLSQWLSRPRRVVDPFECLHIFKQILEFVDLAHSQCVVLRNVRPSSFILSSLHRVSFLDSASSRSSSGSSEPSTGAPSVQALLADTSTLGAGKACQNEVHTFSGMQVAGPVNQGLHWVEEQPHAHGLGTKTDLKLWPLSSNRLDDFIDRVQDGLEVEPRQSGAIRKSRKNGSSGMENLVESRLSGHVSKGFPPMKAFSVEGKSELQENLMKSLSPPFLAGKDQRDECFPGRPTRLMEETWYASPEEMLHGWCSFASDIYSLGVLFFELFCPVNSWDEYLALMSNLRHRILPPNLLSDRPKEAAFCLWLLHPEPNSRPKSREVLRSEILNEVGEALAERQAAMNIEETEAETELLLDFLLHVQQQKQERADKLLKDLACLTSDIQEVKRRRSVLQGTGIQNVPLENQNMSGKLTQDKVSRIAWGSEDSLPRGLETMELKNAGKSGQGMGEMTADESKERAMYCGINSMHQKEESGSKCAHLMNTFDQLEQVYFGMRWKIQPKVFDSNSQIGGKRQPTSSVSVATGAVDADSEVQKVSAVSDSRTQEKDSLGCFFDSLCKYARYSRFVVKATLWQGDLLNTTNMVCSLSFDRDQEYFATAGVCKRIKVFECNTVLNENLDIHYPVVEMMSGSKLSSICWNSYIKSHIASSDYDGVVQLWDASTCQSLMQYKEHGKRAWSVDFSQADPTKLASGSDDGSVKLWSINQEGSIGTIQTKANVCCVQFPRDSAHLIAFGSADYKIYCYDLRNTNIPWCTLMSHSKAVSFVKFLDAGTLVSASTDNTLKLWDLSETSSGGVCKTCKLTYTGHINEKNFVGLSVMDGYIACGSETNSVFAYHKTLPMPMASHKFGCMDPLSGRDTEDDAGQFVSSVCWRGKSQTLVAANSMGSIKVLELV